MIDVNAVLVACLPLLFGVLLYRYAEPVTRLSEQLDAIGSTTRLASVEPTRWNVILTKGIAVMLVMVGGWLLFGALLA